MSGLGSSGGGRTASWQQGHQSPKCTSFVFWMMLAGVRDGEGTTMPVINAPVPSASWMMLKERNGKQKVMAEGQHPESVLPGRRRPLATGWWRFLCLPTVHVREKSWGIELFLGAMG